MDTAAPHYERSGADTIICGVAARAGASSPLPTPSLIPANSRRDYRTPTGRRATRRARRVPDQPSARPSILLALPGLGFVLLIGCLNVAHLLLARGGARKDLRPYALGPHVAAWCCQVLTESALYSLFVARSVGWGWGQQMLRAAARRPSPGREVSTTAVCWRWCRGDDRDGVLFAYPGAARIARHSIERCERERRRRNSDRRARACWWCLKSHLPSSAHGCWLSSNFELQAIDRLDPRNVLTMVFYPSARGLNDPAGRSTRSRSFIRTDGSCCRAPRVRSVGAVESPSRMVRHLVDSATGPRWCRSPGSRDAAPVTPGYSAPWASCRPLPGFTVGDPPARHSGRW